MRFSCEPFFFLAAFRFLAPNDMIIVEKGDFGDGCLLFFVSLLIDDDGEGYQESEMIEVVAVAIGDD